MQPKRHLGFAVGRLIRREYRDHALEGLVHGELTRRPQVELADRWPTTVGDEVARRGLLVKPARTVQLQVHAEGDLQEADHRAVELLDEDETTHPRDLDLAVEPERRVGLGR